MVAQVVAMDERRTYRTPEGKERDNFTAIPDWLYVYMPKLARGIGWNLLSLILHHQRMCERNRPVAISTRQFMKETGASKPTVLKGLDDLAKAGLLYEELEDPTHRDSTICYAIQGEPGQGVVEEEDGSLAVLLLGGWYEVDPTKRISRSGAGGQISLPPQNEGVGGQKTIPPRSRNFTTQVKKFDHPGNVSLPPLASQPSQKAASSSLESIEREREEEEGQTATPTPLKDQTATLNSSDSQTVTVVWLSEKSEQYKETPMAELQSEQPTKRRRKQAPAPSLFSGDESQALLEEGKDVIRELRKSVTWVEDGDEAVGWLDTLLRVKRYPLPWLLDEAASYRGWKKTKSGKHTWDGFEKWCRNPAAVAHLARYHTQEAESRRQEAAALERNQEGGFYKPKTWQDRQREAEASDREWQATMARTQSAASSQQGGH